MVLADQIPESEAAQKKAEADRLRAAEKFMVVGTGEAICAGCGYEYMPKNGDPEYPITPGTMFTVYRAPQLFQRPMTLLLHLFISGQFAQLVRSANCE